MRTNVACVCVLMALALQATGAEPARLVSSGSDTLNGLLRALGSGFEAANPHIAVEVLGLGTLKGFEDLTGGAADMCPAVRLMTPEEEARFSARHAGAKPFAVQVGFDEVCVFVHEDNPIKEISKDQLARIYASVPDAPEKDGKGRALKEFGSRIETWGKVGVDAPAWREARVVRFGRGLRSAMGQYFHMHVLDGRAFDTQMQEMPGNSSVLNAVATTRHAIGFGGKSFMPGDVKALPVSAKEGGEAVLATPETVAEGTYPLSLPLWIYTSRKPAGALKEFLAYALSAEGQDIVAGKHVGLVKLTEAKAAREAEKLKE